jgi:hypothetical protein
LKKHGQNPLKGHEATQLDVTGQLRCDRCELLIGDHDDLVRIDFVATNQLIVAQLLSVLRAMALSTQWMSGPVDQLHRRLL